MTNHAADSNSSRLTQTRRQPRMVSLGSSIKNCPRSLFSGYPTRREFPPSEEGASERLSTINSSCLPSAVLTDTTASLGCCPSPTVRTFTRYIASPLECNRNDTTHSAALTRTAQAVRQWARRAAWRAGTSRRRSGGVRSRAVDRVHFCRHIRDRKNEHRGAVWPQRPNEWHGKTWSRSSPKPPASYLPKLSCVTGAPLVSQTPPDPTLPRIATCSTGAASC